MVCAVVLDDTNSLRPLTKEALLFLLHYGSANACGRGEGVRRRAVNDIIANGRFRGVPVLGVTVTNSPDNGGQVVVYTVEDGYGAAEAGIQPGDVLLKADGQPLHQINDLMAVRRTHLVDDTMTLTVLRDGQVFDVEVPLYANKG